MSLKKIENQMTEDFSGSFNYYYFLIVYKYLVYTSDTFVSTFLLISIMLYLMQRHRKVPECPKLSGTLPRSEERQDRWRTWKPSIDPITGRRDPALSPSGSRGSLSHLTMNPNQIHSLFSQGRLKRFTRATLNRKWYNKHRWIFAQELLPRYKISSIWLNE